MIVRLTRDLRRGAEYRRLGELVAVTTDEALELIRDGLAVPVVALELVAGLERRAGRPDG